MPTHTSTVVKVALLKAKGHAQCIANYLKKQ